MVRAFFGTEFLQDFADIPPKIVSGSRTVLPQEMLELSEHLLDQVGVGAAGREEQRAGACASYCRAHRFGLVDCQ